MRALLGALLILSFGIALVAPVALLWPALVLAIGFVPLKGRTPRQYFSQLDNLLYDGERALVAVSLAVMAGVVFIDVVWRTAHSLTPQLTVGFLVGIFVFCLVGGFTARWEGATLVQRIGAGLGAFALFSVAGYLIYLAPNGFGWSQRLALVLLLWVGLLGSAIATREGRHIAVDAAKKVVPERFRRGFEIAAGVLTVSLCLFLAALGYTYARANYLDWIDSEMQAAIFESIPIPYWTATLPIPLGFGLMAVRFFGDLLYGAKEVDLMTSVGAGPTGGES